MERSQWLFFAVVQSLSFLLLVSSQTTLQPPMCSAPSPVEFNENNTVGDVVTTITINDGVLLEFRSPSGNPDNLFILEGNQLKVSVVLDYEVKRSHVIQITCTDSATEAQLPLVVIVLVQNVNDNPPVFNQESYSVNINEMSPVNSEVGNFAATDADNLGDLYYTLKSEFNYFRLRSSTSAEVLVNSKLDYDTVKQDQLVLTVQDTPLTMTEERASYTATTTITVIISDGDNRPPWFQPCTPYDKDGVLICQGEGYTSWVVLNEQATGVLPLTPGPLFAIDGDSGINEEITYSFLSGNVGDLFEINPNTGNIIMLKAADVLGKVILTVMAAQKINSYQFATTTVTIDVQVKSHHPPVFQKPQYDGIISTVGSIAIDRTTDMPLQIIATDEDYNSVEGINPNIAYSITGSNDFSIIDGYLVMMNNLPDSTLSLQVIAKDTSNDESATSELKVEVKSGLTTTALPPVTTESQSTASTEGPSTSPSMSTDSSISTTGPSGTSGSTVTTTDPSWPITNITSTPEGSLSTTTTTAQPVNPGFGVSDMAALGATLGVLLFICLVVIGVLVHRMQKGKANSKKIFEASLFRSSLGDQKGGIQYTNEAFQKDEDGGSIGSGGPGRGGVMTSAEPPKSTWDRPSNEAIQRSSAPLHALLPDDTSDKGSDKADSEKEVKPILTKERRVEEGYKSVWFKEDIVPNAKEEVVIIPDSREEDSEEDSEEDDDQAPSSRKEDGEDQMKKAKVLFADADLDSGLGVKIEDPTDDSDSEEALNVDL